MLLPSDMSAQIAALQKARKLPADLSPDQVAKLRTALSRYSGQVSQKVLDGILDDFKSKIHTAMGMTDAVQMRGVLADLQRAVGGSEEIAERVRFALDVSQQVASGGGRYLNQNLSPEALDEYPALELKRMFQRDVPRGFKRGAKGAIVPDPDDSWESRWEAAGGVLTDGRMVALKSDEVWQNLGDGDGGYDDTLGNPFPPFAFNSGFMTYDISRAEAVDLGLMAEDDQAEPSPINFSKLFGEVAA